MKLIAIVVLVLCLLWGCKQEKEIKFLQLNIWQEGVMVKMVMKLWRMNWRGLMLILSC